MGRLQFTMCWLQATRCLVSRSQSSWAPTLRRPEKSETPHNGREALDRSFTRPLSAPDLVLVPVPMQRGRASRHNNRDRRRSGQDPAISSRDTSAPESLPLPFSCSSFIRLAQSSRISPVSLATPRFYIPERLPRTSTIFNMVSSLAHPSLISAVSASRWMLHHPAIIGWL